MYAPPLRQAWIYVGLQQKPEWSLRDCLFSVGQFNLNNADKADSQHTLFQEIWNDEKPKQLIP